MKKNNFQNLINLAKEQNQPKALQKVVPVKISSKEEVQFSFYIEKTLLKKIKQISINEDTSIKKIINSAIIEYLESRNIS